MWIVDNLLETKIFMDKFSRMKVISIVVTIEQRISRINIFKALHLSTKSSKRSRPTVLPRKTLGGFKRWCFTSALNLAILTVAATKLMMNQLETYFENVHVLISTSGYW